MYAASILALADLSMDGLRLLDPTPIQPVTTVQLPLPGEPSTLALAMVAITVISGYISVMRLVRPKENMRQLIFTRSWRDETRERKAA